MKNPLLSSFDINNDPFGNFFAANLKEAVWFINKHTESRLQYYLETSKAVPLGDFGDYGDYLHFVVHPISVHMRVFQ